MNEELLRLYALKQRIDSLTQELHERTLDFKAGERLLSEEMKWHALYLIPGLTEQGVIVETFSEYEKFCIKFRPIS